MGLKKIEELKQITAILPKGVGFQLLQVLHNNNVTTANVQHARGSFVGGSLDSHGDLRESELELLTCICAEKSSEKIFHLIYEKAHLDQPKSGFMYMESLGYGTPYKLPELEASGK